MRDGKEIPTGVSVVCQWPVCCLSSKQHDSIQPCQGGEGGEFWRCERGPLLAGWVTTHAGHQGITTGATRRWRRQSATAFASPATAAVC